MATCMYPRNGKSSDLNLKIAFMRKCYRYFGNIQILKFHLIFLKLIFEKFSFHENNDEPYLRSLL